MGESRVYIYAALRRAMLRASKEGDILTREGTQRVLRELLDGEGVYLKELPRRCVRRPARDPNP